MSHMDIASLPFELLTLIINHISPDTSSLANLCKVSKTWNTAATPVLYQNFRQYEDGRRQHAVYHFTYTILARPDLAQYVRHLALGRLRSIGRQKLRIHDHFLHLCIDFIINLFATWLGLVMCDEARHAWIDHFEYLLPATFQSILICALPNLETLYLEDDPEMVYVWQIFNAASRLVPRRHLGSQTVAQEIPFLRLHSIRRGPHQRIVKETMYDFCGLFKLPNIHKLEFSNMDGKWRDAFPELHEWTLSPRSSPVQYLSLQHSNLSTDCLAAVVGICARLKEFHYTSGCRNTHECSPEDILEQLLLHAKTLETLHLNFETIRSAIRHGRHTLDDRLSRFKKLKRLVLSYDTLFTRGVDQDYIAPGYSDSDLSSIPTQSCFRLPDLFTPSLETFELQNCSPNVLPHIQDLDCAKRAGQLICLRLVKLGFPENAVHATEFEHMTIFGVDVKCRVYEKFHDTCSQCIKDHRGSVPAIRSNIFEDEMMMSHELMGTSHLLV